MLKKSKLFLALAAGLIMCLMVSVCLTGCGSSSNEAPAEEPAAEAPADEPAAEAPAEAPAEEPATDTSDTNKEIGEDKALEIAIKDAGVTKADLTNIRVHLDVDDGVTEYEVEFYKGATEYEYSIDAYTGDILEKDIDND